MAKTLNEKLGEDAHNIALGALDTKSFRYVGVKSDLLPPKHVYKLGNIDYGKCTLIIQDKTDGRILDVRLDTLNFFREILPSRVQTSPKYTSPINSDGPKGTYAGFAPLGGALKR